MKELQLLGLDESMKRILDQLNEIKYVVTVMGTSKSDILCSFSKGSLLAETITSLYGLKTKYIPVR
jgi:hypothetical protein